ncbi:MAG: hypothetical protein IPL49_01915 [Saprospirales bacterium]|nr:hypothetical protein [Saprospirales bacterium]MBK8489674.1 hypothetical protein [Saprospirales bacterium]
MTDFFEIQFNWWHLVKAAAWLVGVYFLLKITARWLGFGKIGSMQLGGSFLRGLQSGVQLGLTLFEPAAALILGGIFIFINPALHGAVVLLLLVAGFSSLRNYVNGRILLLNSSVAGASRIEISAGEGGLIARKGRLGLFLRTDNGLRYIPYSTLLEQGYTLVSGDDMGRLFRIRLVPKEEPGIEPGRLRGLLATTPYLDQSHVPELKALPGNVFEVDLLLRDEKYLPDLVQLTSEWGWVCKTN